MNTTLTVPNDGQVSPLSRDLFAALKKKIGNVPNLYATIGYSDVALSAFLNFEETLAKSVFSPKEREAVNLVVSQANACNYCLAAHSMLAGMRGYSKAEILDLRRGTAADPKLQAALQVAKVMVERKGEVDDATLEAFFSQDYTPGALMELTALVTLRTFTNYVYALTKIPIDFPQADPL